MASEAAFKFVKILFIFLNVLFFTTFLIVIISVFISPFWCRTVGRKTHQHCQMMLMGVAMVGIGVYVQITQSDFLALLPKYEYVNVVGVMIAAGIIVLVVTFIGFCGAWMESQCMLIIYITAVMVVFALQISVGIIGFIYRDGIEGTLESQLLEGLKDPARRGSWDVIQKEFRCCGVNSAQDWQNDASSSVPDSCCQYRGCGSAGTANAYKSGCYSKSKEFIKDNFYVLGAAGIGLGVLQIFLMAIAIAMVCCIRKRVLYVA